MISDNRAIEKRITRAYYSKAILLFTHSLWSRNKEKNNKLWLLNMTSRAGKSSQSSKLISKDMLFILSAFPYLIELQLPLKEMMNRKM